MKRKSYTLFIFAIIVGFSACKSDVEPTVASSMLDTGSSKLMRHNAFSNLYDFYLQADKSREYFEVIAKRNDNFIVNFYPQGKLLTICQDAGSGWSDQIANVSEAELKRLVDLKVPLDSIRHFVYKDKTLQESVPFVPIKTNGKPSGY